MEKEDARYTHTGLDEPVVCAALLSKAQALFFYENT